MICHQEESNHQTLANLLLEKTLTALPHSCIDNEFIIYIWITDGLEKTKQQWTHIRSPSSRLHLRRHAMPMSAGMVLHSPRSALPMCHPAALHIVIATTTRLSIGQLPSSSTAAAMVHLAGICLHNRSFSNWIGTNLYQPYLLPLLWLLLLLP
jgi:hypothetical protein